MQTEQITHNANPGTECPHKPVTKRETRDGLFNCPQCSRVNFTGFSHCLDCGLPLH